MLLSQRSLNGGIKFTAYALSVILSALRASSEQGLENLQRNCTLTSGPYLGFSAGGGGGGGGAKKISKPQSGSENYCAF